MAQAAAAAHIPAEQVAFLNALLAAVEAANDEQDGRWPAHRRTSPDGTETWPRRWFEPDYLDQLTNADIGASTASPHARRWWDELACDLRARFPNADDLALDWLSDIPGRVARISQFGSPHRPCGEIWRSSDQVLLRWFALYPPSDAPERVQRTLLGWLATLAPVRTSKVSSSPDRVDRIADGYAMMLAMLAMLLAEDEDSWLAFSIPLLDAALRVEPTPARWVIWRHLVADIAVRLWRSGDLSRANQRRLLQARPELARFRGRSRDRKEMAGECATVVRRVLDEGIEQRRIDRQTGQLLRCFDGYAGIDDLQRPLRWLKRRLPDRGNAWIAELLPRLAAPDGSDDARAGELAAFDPADLFAVGLLAPAWAPLIGQAVPAPELAGIADLAQWATPYQRSSPWRRWADPAVWDARDLAADRAALRRGAAATGEATLCALLDHPTLRVHARPIALTIGAALGWNRAEIEARFAQRDKWAACALGIVPDEGDILDRYHALRGFADESARFGRRRQRSERRAAAIGLAQLAVTAGLATVAELEREFGAES